MNDNNYLEIWSFVIACVSLLIAIGSFIAMICIAKSTGKFSKNQSTIEQRLWERNEQQLTSIDNKINDFMNLVTVYILKTNTFVEEISTNTKEIDKKLDNFQK